MKDSTKSFDVFDFNEDDELAGMKRKRINTTCRVSVRAEVHSKEINPAVCESADAASIYYNHNTAGSFTSEAENLACEHKSNLKHVLNNHFKDHERTAEIESNIPVAGNICDEEHISMPGVSAVFQEMNINGESPHLGSDGEESMHERHSSPTYRSASSDELSSDNEEWGSEMEADGDGVGVVLNPDYIDYCGDQYLDPVITFLRDSVEIKSKAIYNDQRDFHINLEIDDIVKIESRWSAQFNTVDVNICFISKEAESDILHNASEIQELRFHAIDSNWYNKQVAIAYLDVKYKAVWDVLLDTAAEKCSVLPAGKVLMPSKSYFPNFKKPFDALTYPKGDPDAVCISKRDIERLQPDTFVNDTIIDFYIKYLRTQLSNEERIKYHFFNSFFFRKLADMDKDPNSAVDGHAAFQRVRKWTRKVNMLEKDFIFIPVNYNLHWSVIVICYFSEAATYRDIEGDQSVRVPCVLHMNSIKESHTGLKDLMQSYLWEEWKERHKETCEDLQSKFSNLKFVSLELPQQQNAYDCGLFLLHYVEAFLKDVPADFNIHKLSPNSEFLQANWFPPGEASMKRVHIEKLFNYLLETQSEDSRSQGGIDIHSSSGRMDVVDHSEKSSTLRSCPGRSLCAEVKQGIDMTLLPGSSLNTQHAASTGLILDLFGSSASDSLNNASWEDSKDKKSLDEFKSPDFLTEEKAEHFSLTQSDNLDGITAGVDLFPYSNGELQSDHVAFNEAIDSPQISSSSVSDVLVLDADDELQCFSSLLMDCPVNQDSGNDTPLGNEANQSDLNNASNPENDKPIDADNQIDSINASDSEDDMIIIAKSPIADETDLVNNQLADKANCAEFTSDEKLDIADLITEDSSKCMQVDDNLQYVGDDEQLPHKRIRVNPPEIL